MRELLRELAIIRENEQSFALRVEPADIKEPRKLWRQQIKNRVPRVRVPSCRDKTSGLVQNDVQRSRGPHEFAIDFHVVARGRLRAKIGAQPTINCNTPARTQLVTLSALLQKLDPLEAFQDIALSGDRAGSSQTTML